MVPRLHALCRRSREQSTERLFFYSDNSLIITKDAGRSLDGGKTWVRQNNIKVREDFSYNPANGTGPHCIYKIRSRDGIRVWAIDYISGVLFSEDGGEHGEEQYLPCNNQRFTDMYFYNDNHI